MALARRAIIVAAGVMGYLGIAEIQFACGGGSPIPHFDRPDGPGHSEASYIDGQLGIIHGSYRHDYLFWAFRLLSGKHFDEEERTVLLEPEVPGWRELESSIEEWSEAKRLVARAGSLTSRPSPRR